MLTHILAAAGGTLFGTAVTAWWAHSKLHALVDTAKTDIIAEFNKVVARVKAL